MESSSSAVFETPEALAELNDVIHDNWFCLSEITYDPARRTLWIPFERRLDEARESRKRGLLIDEVLVPVQACTLVVEQVEDVDFSDAEGIDCYDFNVIRVDDGRMVVESNIPTRFVVSISGLKVRLEFGHIVRRDRVKRLSLAPPSRLFKQE